MSEMLLIQTAQTIATERERTIQRRLWEHTLQEEAKSAKAAPPAALDTVLRRRRDASGRPCIDCPPMQPTTR
jgi:hypothetical protein